jgi:hypothetical protein
VRKYQLDPTITNPWECPLAPKPNNGLLITKFDKALFDKIQGIWKGHYCASLDRSSSSSSSGDSWDGGVTDSEEDIDPWDIEDSEIVHLNGTI